MQFAARLHPLQRAPVELHDTSRGARRCGAIQCNCLHSSDASCRPKESVSLPVGHSRLVPATGPIAICRKMIEDLLCCILYCDRE